MQGVWRRKGDDEIENNIQRHKNEGVKKRERIMGEREGVRDRGVQKGICFV